MFECCRFVVAEAGLIPVRGASNQHRGIDFLSTEAIRGA